MVDSIVSLIGSLGYFGIFILMFAETLFPPLPSEAVMPFAGFAASRGEMNLYGAIVAGSLGSLLGATGIFWLSRFLKDHHVEGFVAKHGRFLGLRVKDVHAAQSWFDKRGLAAVLLCRMIPGVRSLISIPAGLRRMPLGTFLLYSFIGTVAWTAALTVGGYALGNQYHVIEEKVGPLSKIVLGILVISVATLLFIRLTAEWRTKRRATKQ